MGTQPVALAPARPVPCEAVAWQELSERPDCEDRFRLLAGLTGQAVYEIDLTSLCVSWTGAVERVTGWTPEELSASSASRGPQEMVCPDDRVEVTAALERALQEVRSYRLAYRLRRKDGSEARVEDRGAFVRGASGRPVRMIGSLMDVSRLWELEHRLAQAQRMEALGQLAGGVAHDFNNIVSIVMCYAEQGLRLSGPEGPASHALEQILKASSRGAALTRQILALSRKGAACPVVANLNNIIKDTQGMLRRMIGEDVTLVTDLDPDLLDVVVDVAQIERVLMNLAANARDAMVHGGTLTLKTANVDPEGGGSAPCAGRHRVLLRVGDTGHGMSPEVLSHIFEPFFTTKPEGHGTGLGLATVVGIMRQCGGEIEVDSALGQGTTFSMHFPVAASEKGVALESARPAKTGGNETLLVVEDDNALLEIIGDGLRRQGYRVLAATSGQQALELATQYAGVIHLLVTDVIMPGMSGYELVGRLVVARPDLRVLYVSGYTADFMARKGLRVQRTELLSKPFSDEALQARIRALLDGAEC